MSQVWKSFKSAEVVKITDAEGERTQLDYERTLLAWIRTATSMISFGFTLYKFFAELNQTQKPVQHILTPRVAGMVMIGFGVMALLLAEMNYVVAIRRLKEYYSRARYSFSFPLALLMLIFGLLLFVGALLRQ
jgi:putative membrane protein